MATQPRPRADRAPLREERWARVPTPSVPPGAKPASCSTWSARVRASCASRPSACRLAFVIRA